MKDFHPIDIMNQDLPVFRMLAKDWMLITAGTKGAYNTMTASWGSLGFLWNMPVATIFVRPQRYTFDFTERSDGFSLSFFGGEHRDALNFCGSHSGRSYDKAKETGLTPIELPSGIVAFAQAHLIIDCEKIYSDYIKQEAFVNSEIDSSIYSKKDYHKLYIGRVKNGWVKNAIA